jgi:bifunctional non-homologous end joining protein LigD
MAANPLQKYKAERDSSRALQMAEGGALREKARAFVIQKHWATRLHYDFRLELEGAMKSWAVPKGPSYDPKDKRMAVHVEDHPMSYNTFEGQIPEGQYGAGKVIVWDEGTWRPMGDPLQGYQDGNLKFELHGRKLRGHWALIKIKSRHGKDNAWLLIKERDGLERPAAEFSVIDEFPDSVATLPSPEGAKTK